MKPEEKLSKTFRTQLYGDVEYTGAEVEIMHTPVFQRLYDLKELGFTDRIWPDAVHSRFNHVIGAVERIRRIIDSIEKLVSKKNEDEGTLSGLSLDYSMYSHGQWETKNFSFQSMRLRFNSFRARMRMMALLHDITQTAYGHTLEDEVGIFEQKHDNPERQALFFNVLTAELFICVALENLCHVDIGININELHQLGSKLMGIPDIAKKENLKKTVVDIAQNVIAAAESSEKTCQLQLFDPNKSDFLGNLLYSFEALIWLDFLETFEEKKRTEKDFENYQKFVAEIPILLKDILKGRFRREPHDKFVPCRDRFLLDAVGNTVCADLLDYARRDPKTLGMVVDYDDRIFKYFVVVSHKEDGSPVRFLRTGMRFFTTKLRTDMIGELIQVLHARLFIHERVLYHRTKCCVGAMLATAIQLMGLDQSNARDFHMLGRGDSNLIHSLLVASLKSWRDQNKKESFAAYNLLYRIKARRFFSPVYTVLKGVSQGTGRNYEDVAADYQDPESRFKLERLIEKQTDLPMGSICIHCPSTKGSQKLSNVLVVGEDWTNAKPLRKLSELGDLLFRDHQKAVEQMEAMYAYVWRFTVFVDPSFLGRSEEIQAKIAGEVRFECDECLLDELKNVPTPSKTLWAYRYSDWKMNDDAFSFAKICDKKGIPRRKYIKLMKIHFAKNPTRLNFVAATEPWSEELWQKLIDENPE